MAQPTGYSASQIWLHWLVALLIVPQFLAHDPIVEAWRAISRGQEVTPSILIVLHIVVGVAILALVLWRLVLRLRRGAPLPPAEEAPSLQLVGKLTHGALYLLLVALAATGGLAWFVDIKVLAGAHGVLTKLLLIVVGLHIAGALYQQFVLKTNLIARMKTPG